MLVDVIEIRRKGERLPRETIRGLQPVRGVLTLSPGRPGWYAGQKRPRLLAGLVHPIKCEWMLRPLASAQVTRIRNGALLIVGLQEEGQRDRDIRDFVQEWVARPVGGPAADQKREPMSGSSSAGGGAAAVLRGFVARGGSGAA